MVDDATRDEADRQAAHLAACLVQLIPWLTQFVRSLVGHAIAARPDVEDIVNTTLLQMLLVLRRANGPIHDPRRYLMKVARSCIADHFERKNRQPPPIDNLDLFVDGRFVLPEQAAQDREESEARERGLRWWNQWRPRCCNTLISLDGQLGELDDFRAELSPLLGLGQVPRKRTKGRPAKIEQPGHLLVELRPTVAVLIKFLSHEL
jgi:DNA-directed RNA polymerase specialized sigma24 family protein